jgi:hypothetical protein
VRAGEETQAEGKRGVDVGDEVLGFRRVSEVVVRVTVQRLVDLKWTTYGTLFGIRL